jgi:hypothetical protein
MDTTDIFVNKILTDSPDSVNRFSVWDIHNQGLIELIRLRGLEQFKSEDGRNLFCIIFNTMVSLSRPRCLVIADNVIDSKVGC